jgi:hypothetical protein
MKKALVAHELGHACHYLINDIYEFVAIRKTETGAIAQLEVETATDLQKAENAVAATSAGWIYEIGSRLTNIPPANFFNLLAGDKNDYEGKYGLLSTHASPSDLEAIRKFQPEELTQGAVLGYTVAIVLLQNAKYVELAAQMLSEGKAILLRKKDAEELLGNLTPPLVTGDPDWFLSTGQVVSAEHASQMNNLMELAL